MKVRMMEQGTSEWLEARKGYPSASEFKRILTPGGKLSEAWKKYAAQLASDLFSTIPPEGVENYTNNAIRYGQQTEAEARHFYAMDSGNLVHQVGGCIDDTSRFWCSPDGLVNPIFADPKDASEFDQLRRRGLAEDTWPRYCELGERIIGTEGGVELFCPQGETHAASLLNDPWEVHSTKVVQVHGALVVTGAKWWDYCQYSPGKWTPIRVRTEPNEFTAKLRAALEEFHPKLMAAIGRIRGTKEPQ